MSDQNTIEFDQDTAPQPMPRRPEDQPTTVMQATPPVEPKRATPPTQVQEVDVDPSEALRQAQTGEDTTAPEAEPEKEDVVDILEPKAEPRVWKFGPQDMPLEYTQRPLSFLGKMQWFSLVGDVLDKSMSGPNGVSVNELLSGPGDRTGNFSLADFRDADQFVRALGKLVVYAPDFIEKSFCIWLGVPDYQRAVVIEVMQRHESEGGLSDDQGLEIIEVFIDQNYDALADFFGGRVVKLRQRVEQRMKDRNARK